MTDKTCHVSSTTTAYPLLINPTTFIPSQMYAQTVPLMLSQPALPTFSHDIPTIIITPSPPQPDTTTSSQDVVSAPPSDKSVIVNVIEDPVAPRPCLKDRFMTLLFSGCLGTALSYLVSSILLADKFELMTAYNGFIFIATIISMLIPVVLLPLVETKGGQLTTFKRVAVFGVFTIAALVGVACASRVDLEITSIDFPEPEEERKLRKIQVYFLASCISSFAISCASAVAIMLISPEEEEKEVADSVVYKRLEEAFTLQSQIITKKK